MSDLATAGFKSPTPSNATKTAVYTFAEQVATALGYEPGADLEALVKRLGGKIEHDAWDVDEGSGSLEVYPGDTPGFLIRLPCFAGRLRNRFTIAHELGHYFLHSKGGKERIRIAREGSDRCEWEANWFAAGFLLPETRFRQDFQTHLGNVAQLASLYQVSQPVIEIRRSYLELA